jgi:hypothetical protein
MNVLKKNWKIIDPELDAMRPKHRQQFRVVQVAEYRTGSTGS